MRVGYTGWCGKGLRDSEIVVDLDACRVTTAPGDDGCDPRPLQYLFPPAVAARLRRDGRPRQFAVQLRDLDEIAERAQALFAGR